LLVVSSGPKIYIIDPANPASPVGEYSPLQAGRRIVISDGYAYIADETDGLKIIWLAAPDRPVQVFGETGDPALDIWVDGDVAYVAGTSGLRILDVSNRFRPLEISRLPLPGQPQGISVYENIAYVALGPEGVGTINISNRAAPALERRITFGGEAKAVTYSGGILYVAAGDSGLAVIQARA
jgi:hypothetical protein